MGELTRLANTFGTDKGTTTGAAHGYSLIYDTVLGPMRRYPRVDLLELGLAIGGPELGGNADRLTSGSPSVDLWLNYFDNAHVVGFDISDFSEIRHDRFQFIRGDGGRQEDLDQVAALNRQFDVIIDDASHASYHQQLGLAALFKLLKPGGLYIIEDLGWRPSGYEASLPKVWTTAKVLTQFMRTGEFVASPAISQSAARELRANVSSVQLYDESLLNAIADTYNRRFGRASVRRSGWRGRIGLSRSLSPYYWLFNLRRFRQSLDGEEFAMHHSVKLAILQRMDVTSRR